MAKATTTVEPIEEKFPTRPNDLAKELDMSPKVLRSFLRQEFTRPAEKKNSSWELTKEMVIAARERFTKEADEVEAETT